MNNYKKNNYKIKKIEKSDKYLTKLYYKLIVSIKKFITRRIYEVQNICCYIGSIYGDYIW